MLRKIFPIVFLLIFSANLHAQEVEPFDGVIVGKSVRIRAGANENYEELIRLNEGDRVKVVEKAYTWYKIQLPPGAKSYVSSKYIISVDDKNGMISGDRVNVRAGASVNSSVITQLGQGDKIVILEKLPDWYKIQPVENSYGWVKEEFIAKDTNPNPPMKVEEPAQVQSSSVEKIAEKGPVRNFLDNLFTQQGTSASGDQAEELSLIGTVELLKTPAAPNIRHQLILENKSVYLLEGYQDLIDGFLNYKVNVNGSIHQDAATASLPSPVLKVRSIKLAL